MKQAIKAMRIRHGIMETRLTSGPGMRQGTGGAMTHQTGSYVRDRAPGGVGSGPRRPAPVTAGAVTHQTGSDVRA